MNRLRIVDVQQMLRLFVELEVDVGGTGTGCQRPSSLGRLVPRVSAGAKEDIWRPNLTLAGRSDLLDPSAEFLSYWRFELIRKHTTVCEHRQRSLVVSMLIVRRWLAHSAMPPSRQRRKRNENPPPLFREDSIPVFASPDWTLLRVGQSLIVSRCSCHARSTSITDTTAIKGLIPGAEVAACSGQFTVS